MMQSVKRFCTLLIEALEPLAYPLVREATDLILATHGAARLRVVDNGGPTVEKTAQFMSAQGFWFATVLTYASRTLN
jgi:hypothetical protein